MTIVIPPYKMRGPWREAMPYLDGNFLEMAVSPESFSPRVFSSLTTGARPDAGVLFTTVGTFLDRPEYSTYATLTQEYDIFVDSGTNATGTLGIDNTGGVAPYPVSVGDYFTIFLEPDDSTRRIYIATSSTSVGAGGTGSVTLVAERPGTRFNVTGAVGASALGSSYNRYDLNNLSTITRYVNLTPNTPGGGGGITLSITTSGGAGVENDPTHLWPNGSALSAGQKLLTTTDGLLSSTALPANWSNQVTNPYTKAFATTYVSILNGDSAPHTITVSLQGEVFSGAPTYTINR